MLNEQNLLSTVQKIFLHLVTALIHLLNLLNLKLKDLLTNQQFVVVDSNSGMSTAMGIDFLCTFGTTEVD